MIMSKELCAAVLANASELDGKKFANIPLSILCVDDDYQRITGGKLKKLVKEWNKDYCNPLLVSYRDDRFYILDGQHRWLAAKSNNVECLPCKIYVGLSKTEEAKIFARQDTCVTRLTPYDTYKANLIIGDVVDTAIRAVCAKYGVTVDKKRITKPANLNAVVAARQIYSSCGKDGLEWVFSVIYKSGWHKCRKAYGKVILNALRFTYEHYKASIKQNESYIIDTLKENTPNSIIIKARHKFSYCTDKEAVYRLITNSVSSHIERVLEQKAKAGDVNIPGETYQTLFS